MRKRTWGGMVVVVAVLSVLLVPAGAMAGAPPPGPIFGLGTDQGGDVLVANSAVGVTTAGGALVAPLPGISDVAASDQGWLWATTSGPDAKLYKVEGGVATEFADLGAYEAKHNPHPAAIDTNPYGVADLGGGEAVVADAAGNTLLKVNKHGKVKLVAILPDELVPTDNAKSLVEEALTNMIIFGDVTCDALPDFPPELEELGEEAAAVCGLPDMIPAEPVATSVAVGPNGDFYVGELKGFPAPLGASKVWRIRWNARNADCNVSPLCSVAYDGFTSVVDLTFGDDGTLYVAELEEKSWLAVEFGLFFGLPVALEGGTVNACAAGACVEVAAGVDLLSAVTTAGDGTIWWAGLFGPVAPLP